MFGAAGVHAGNTRRNNFGVLAKDFQYLEGYPTNTQRGLTPQASWNYLAAQGVRRNRLFTRMGVLQPSGVGTALDSVETTRLLAEIANAYTAGIRTMVVQYDDLGSAMSHSSSNASTAQAALVDFWTRMSTLLKGNPGVLGYDLQNEPADLTSSSSSNTLSGNEADAAVWQPMSQAIVTAIRDNSDTTTIFVEGVNYSNPWDGYSSTWSAMNGSTPWITDPANNTVYSAHCYPDLDGLFNASQGYGSTSDYQYSTTAAWFVANYSSCASIGYPAWFLRRLQYFTDWCASNHVRGDIGETGWPSAYAMTSIQGLSSGTATTEAASWNTNIGVPFLQACMAAGISAQIETATGLANSAWGQSSGTNPFTNSSGGSMIYNSGTNKYNPATIDTAQSPVSAYQTAGIWP